MTAPDPGSSLSEKLVEEVPSLRAFARSLARDHALADDLVQEAILKAWSKLDSFEEGTNLRAWLFTILRNSFITLTRKHKREVQDVDGSHAAGMIQLPAQEGALDISDFRDAFKSLPNEQREAIVLVGAAGFTYDEAAGICGCAPGTVKSRVSRARNALAEMLQFRPGDLSSSDPATMSVLATRRPTQ